MIDNEKPPIFPVLEYYGLEDSDPGGGRMKCICPFHDESRPSASVDVDKQRFRCFACGVQGDAIDIITIQEGLEYSSAVKFLEENFGFSSKALSPRPDARPLRSSLHVANRGAGTKRGNAGGTPVRRRRRGLR